MQIPDLGCGHGYEDDESGDNGSSRGSFERTFGTMC